MDAAALRNFKDFLEIYNKISETCFSKCVDSFQQRDISTEELNCVDSCSNKYVRVNHKVMATYMEVQPLVVQKRIEEMNKLAEEQMQQQQQQQPTEENAPNVSNEEPASTTSDS